MNFDYSEQPYAWMAAKERVEGDGSPGSGGTAGNDPTLGNLGGVGNGAPGTSRPTLIKFRAYQWEAFENRTNGIEVWLWGRQTGKSFTLAAWAVDRLIAIPGRVVTVLSNSKTNGMELNRKCAEVCRLMGRAFEQVDLSPDNRFETMNAETRVTVNGRVGRIVILAANSRTARGFSGDLILDEFAFHENSAEIWKAASPILESNPDYLCRIASTPNGKHNMFYQLATDAKIPLRRVTRTEAHAQGCGVYHPITRKPIDPATARSLAQNKRSYDQNYECVFEDESMALLTHELINAAERPDVGVICSQNWSEACLKNLTEGRQGREENGKKSVKRWLVEAEDEAAMTRHILMQVCNGSVDRFYQLLESSVEIRISDVFDEVKMRRKQDEGRMFYAGVDVGRNNDRTVVTVVEKIGNTYLARAILRLSEMRLPEQQARLEEVLKLREVRCAKIDMTGLGLGLVEYTQEKLGRQKVLGVNFASNVPVSAAMHKGDRHGQTVRVTEALATQLLQAFEDRAVQIPIDAELRDDLRKPERFLSPSGRVSIAATRTETGHADHFWSLALAIDAAQNPVPAKFEWHSWKPRGYRRYGRL